MLFYYQVRDIIDVWMDLVYINWWNVTELPVTRIQSGVRLHRMGKYYHPSKQQQIPLERSFKEENRYIFKGKWIVTRLASQPYCKCISVQMWQKKTPVFFFLDLEAAHKLGWCWHCSNRDYVRSTRKSPRHNSTNLSKQSRNYHHLVSYFYLVSNPLKLMKIKNKWKLKINQNRL